MLDIIFTKQKILFLGVSTIFLDELFKRTNPSLKKNSGFVIHAIIDANGNVGFVILSAHRFLSRGPQNTYIIGFGRKHFGIGSIFDYLEG